MGVKSITKLGTLVFCACTGLLFLVSATQGLSCYHCTFFQDVGEGCQCRLNPPQDEKKCEDWVKFPRPDDRRSKNNIKKNSQKPRQAVGLCSIKVLYNSLSVDLLRYSKILYPEYPDPDVNITSKCTVDIKLFMQNNREQTCYCDTDWCNGQPLDFPDFWPTTTTKLPCPSTTTTTTTQKSTITTSTPGTSTTPCAPNPPTKPTTPQSVTSSAFNNHDDYFIMHKYWILSRTTSLVIGSLLLQSGIGHV